VKEIGILIFDGVEELDAVGPWEVLACWARDYPEDDYSVSFVSVDGASVVAAKGLTLTPHTSAADMPPLDVFLHPGGIGTRRLMRDESHLAWMNSLAARIPLMTSVCTGALVYAAAGLLHDRPATTHWQSLTLLQELDPTINVRPDDRFVDDGDVVTSAGVSAGIDMSLHLVQRLARPERARQVRREIQYGPTPPAGHNAPGPDSS
jgi:transcriptional regulator GlxA family with amidase domain